MTTREIFDTMEYGPAPESDAEAAPGSPQGTPPSGISSTAASPSPRETFATKNPATGEVLAEVTQGTAKDVDAAVGRRPRLPEMGAALRP
jgi:aldehyde dehydrogenase (NAD+)